ncbi:amidase [Sulfurospirillum arcachonense]|uniref:amidase n=1 Tax=Sulfurospirillum arcachonense TaxID=57666 RepID=UPI00046A1681|nr:amidase [Sulfurospirillum arcachonense]
MISDLKKLDATTLLTLLKTKKISPKELAYTYLEHIEKTDQDIGAWEFINKKIIDKQLAKIEKLDPTSHPLWGLPIGIKDIYNTFDMPAQMGSPIWKNFTPGNDARVVHYLRRNGALILGKTATAEFAVHYQDKTKNPLDLTRSPGTSSSGSAAAIAANMAPVTFGSQTAGSIGRPASYCGIYGYKPTFGILPRIGALKTTDSLDTLGFFTKSANDLKLILDASRVHGQNYEYVHKYLDNYQEKKNNKFKVGIVRHPKWHLADNFAKKEFEKFVENIANPNFEIEDVANPHQLEQIHDIHATIYDKTLSYYFKEEYKKHTLISPVFYEIIERGNKITAEEYQTAIQIQAKMIIDMNEYFSKYDVLLTMTTAQEAPVGLTTTDTADSNLIWTYLGMPTVSMPLLKGKNGLPIGVLAIAKKYDDYKLLDIIKKIT